MPKLTIDGIELHRPFEPGEHPDDRAEILEPRMRQGDAMPHPRRPERFAFLEPVHGDGSADAVNGLRSLAQLLKQALLAGHVPEDAHGLGSEQSCDFHM